MEFRKFPIAQGMLSLHTEKPSFPQSGCFPVGQIYRSQIGNRPAVGEKQGIQRTSLLRGIFFIPLQKTAELIQRKPALQKNDFIALLIKVFEGMISSVRDFKKIREAVTDIIRIRTELFIDYYLITVRIQIHFLYFTGGQKRFFLQSDRSR